MNKSIKRIFIVIFSIIVFLLGGLAGVIFYVNTNKPTSDIFVNGELSIHFLELGNKYTGDSIYIKAGDADILIDAGSRNDSSSTIISYVDQYVQDGKLEYVIATHSDQDHISAFYSTNSNTGILDYYDVDTIIDFPNTNKTDPTESSVLGKYYLARDNLVSLGTKHYTALECYNNENGASRIYQLANGIEMEILYNYYYENSSSDENNYSVCLMINQGDNHYLLTGDLENDGEKHLVDYYNQINDPLPECVLYKAGHHGSKTSSTKELLEQIKPQYVVVCCCAGSSQYTDINENQFPTQEFINNIAPYTDKVYITSVVDNYVDKDKWSSEGTVKSMNGNIVFSVSEGIVSINCSNNNLILKETDWFKNNRELPQEWNL